MRFYILLNLLSIGIIIGIVYLLFLSTSSILPEGLSANYIIDTTGKELYFDNNKLYIKANQQEFVLSSDNYKGNIESLKLLFKRSRVGEKEYILNTRCKYLKLTSSEQYYFDELVCLDEI